MNTVLTKNVILRPLTEADWKNYVKHVIAADEVYIQYGMKPTEWLLESIQEPNDEMVEYRTIFNEDDVMVGYVGISRETCSLEFYIFSEYRRKGYGTEALKAFTEVFFEGRIDGCEGSRIIAETLSGNEASMRLLEKVGFEDESVGLRVLLEKKSNAPVCTEVVVSYVLKR